MEIKIIYNLRLFSTYEKFSLVFLNLISRQLKAVSKIDYSHNLFYCSSCV